MINKTVRHYDRWMVIKINPSYCLETSPEDFSKAIKKITRKSKKKDPGFFEITYLMGQMTCRGLDDTVIIPARGDWITPVRISAVALKKLANSLPEQGSIRLGYSEDRFYIDNFSIQGFAITAR
ncbi:MAG: hypothetical protein AB7H77_01070 [Bdellovibrionales bacterium]